ncbi:hypothetical protein PRK78_003180 [Emydomyces testavorans]|uniref:Zn(2)-C6 fungal-type domain-containing protein n=1 Tax=Emydomyces testavorans TaxID=2070801 RepID=A0AAF0DGB8_9EURO|nr:hypothetical protein PRK78_003180 [Emydomyces testavorans]
MSPTVGGHLPPQNEFDIPLNLVTSSSVSAIPDYSGNGGTYQLPTKVDSNPPQKPIPKEGSGQVAGGGTTSAERTAAPLDRSAAPKPKRVRTGCLTCRERHLKCDETLPRCQNCQKSDRLCKRGVRLNFIDTQVAAPPYAVSSNHDWNVNFHDESREIASEYLGGCERYPSLRKETPKLPTGTTYGYRETPAMATPHQGMPSASLLTSFSEHAQPEMTAEPIFHRTPQAPAPDTAYNDHSMTQSPFDSQKHSLAPANEVRPYLNSAEEVLLMQVYVEEVGLWMDSMDADKHFTQILPFHALSEPMLLNALMACGARHLFLVNPSFGEEKALYYYNISTRDLLTCLQDPNRDTVLCATTAVVLNVYEVMCEKAMQRMNHIAGARALIKECRWNAKSTGIGGACFWLNVGMELLSCLHFNWKMAWDPDTWDIDMNMSLNQGSIAGDEEFWTNRMLYICAKIANYRAASAYHGLDRNAHDPRLSQRCEEWNSLRTWCDEWARCAPRSMTPLGYLHPWQTNSKSSFPEVWLIKRSAVVGRLFYHTACCVLAKVHPTESEYSDEMLSMQQSHSHDICGIVAHVKDRGVASVSIRCLAIAAESVVGREAQEEVIAILDKIIKETGWQVGFLQHELIEKWGWNGGASHMSPHQQQMTTAGPSADLGSSLLNSAIPSAVPSRPRMPQGIVNPLMATADFSFDEHPYQNHYVAPHNNHLNNYHYGSY